MLFRSDTPIGESLPQGGQLTHPIVGYHFLVNHALTVTIGSDAIMTHTHMMATLSKPFHLTVYLLTDATVR